MTEKNIASIKVSKTTTYNVAFQVLLFLIWTRHTIIYYVIQATELIPIVNWGSAYYYPFMIIVSAILAWPRMRKHINFNQIIFYMVSTAVILSSIIVFPSNMSIFEQNWVKMLFVVLPMVFIGVSYEHENDKKVLFWASLLGVIIANAYQLFVVKYKGEELMAYNMDAAYKTLPSVSYLVYHAFTNKRLRYWLIAIVGIFTTLSYGARGPLLCLMVLLIIGIYFRIQGERSAVKKSVLVVLGIAALLFVMSGDMMLRTVEALSVKFSKWGLSTRIFEYFVTGDFTSDSGRSDIYGKVFEAIGEKPLIGHGLFGDQMLLGGGKSGYYAHNLFLELWCQFGIFFGSLIAIWFIAWPLVALYRQRRNRSMLLFVCMLISINFVKLMMSSTYTQEQPFFFMLGVCMSAASMHHRTILDNKE